MSNLRQARVAEMIKRDLVEILQREMRDPRLAMTTVTSVEVAPDFSFAKVFVSVLGTTEEKTEAVLALQGAAGFLKGRLGKMLTMRTVPTLAFRLDEGIERGIQMFDLLLKEKEFATSLAPPTAEEQLAIESIQEDEKSKK